MNLIGDFDFPYKKYEYEDWNAFLESIRPPATDPIWPTNCKCGAALVHSDLQERGGQMFAHRLQMRSDNGELTTIQEAPPGALWYAWWMRSDDSGYSWDWTNQTEPPLMCKTPGGDWNIDSRASNCTMKEDRLHRCWIRHGTPPMITVDKNGFTCGAGAGSILSGNWHGFLRNGKLVL
jgi:hypothetical protein